MNRNTLYILILVVTFGLLVAVEYASPKPINWTRTYSQEDKIPYGNYLIFKLLNNIFPNQKIVSAEQTLYEYSQNDTTEGENFIFINDEWKADQLEINALMTQVAEGSNAFIAAHELNKIMTDTLDIKLNTSFFSPEGKAFQDTISLYFTDQQRLGKQKYRYSQGSVMYYFSLPRNSPHEILSRNEYDSAVMVRIKHGEGYFYLHSCPLAFTNYHLLEANHADYIAKSLSYLPVRAVYWDEYQKVGRKGARTPLRYILTVEPLRIAFWISIIGLIIYTLFHAKRQQRPIPIVRAPQNDSLDFVRTVGQLYYQYQDHQNLASKKIHYFYEQLRTQFYIHETPLSLAWQEKLVAKLNQTEQEVKEFVKYIERVQQHSINEKELQDIVIRIDKILKRV